VVLTLALVGCGLGNPTVVVGPDGAFIVEDLGGDTGATVDTGVDAGPRDAASPRDVPIDLGDDAGAPDAGVPDTGGVDGGTPDSGAVDVGAADNGLVDAGPLDAGATDAGPRDAGVVDAGPMDAGLLDAGPRDAGPVDAGPRDAGPADVGFDVPVIPDAGPADAGTVTVTAYTEGCVTSGAAAINGAGRYVITGTTAGRNDDHQATCSNNEGTPDVGYLVTLTEFSRVTWLARPTGAVFAPVVTLTQTCGEQDGKFTNEVACINNAGAAGAARGGSVDLPMGTYYLTVDGDRDGGSAESGAFEVTVTVTASEPAPYYSVEPLTSVTCSAVPSSVAASIENGDDVVSSIQGLGSDFNFNFFGRAFNRMAFYSNGFLAFIVDEANPWPAGTSWRNHSIPFTGQPRGVVAPFWDDLRVDNASGSGVYFWVDGATGGRVAHVTWRNANFFREGSSRVTFEARLYQGTDAIEFLYCSDNGSTGYTRGGSATVGVEAYDPPEGRLVALNRNGAIAPGTGYRLQHR
jgi:hypothetical protein